MIKRYFNTFATSVINSQMPPSSLYTHSEMIVFYPFTNRISPGMKGTLNGKLHWKHSLLNTISFVGLNTLVTYLNIDWLVQTGSVNTF